MITIGSKNKLIIYANVTSSYNSNYKSLFMKSSDFGKTWDKLIEYDGTKIHLKLFNNTTSENQNLLLQIGDKLNKKTFQTYTFK